MEKTSDVFQGKVGPQLFSFLNDFSPTCIVDKEEDVFLSSYGSEKEYGGVVPLSSRLSDFSFGDQGTAILPLKDKKEIMYDDDMQKASSLINDAVLEERMTDFLSLKNSPISKDINVSDVIQKEAVDQAVKEITEKLQTDFSVEKKRMEEEHAQALEEIQQNAVVALGDRISHQLTGDFSSLRQEIAQDVVQILSVIVGKKMTNEILQNFAEEVAKQAVDAKHPLILEGNEKLLEQLKKQKGFNSSQFKFQPTDSTEIRLRRDETVITTQLSSLLTTLQELIQ
ncbi:hypothetical protein PU02_0142 [Bartonella ancashensis]|uniref:Uncharacterized protein n=2 Tax=Bartonella ancashensis TaxID=1318743 RepID=A0A0M4LHG3_9HYPH|nr:hypothetical protein PU02_0142 [Bartonella ancashensis]